MNANFPLTGQPLPRTEAASKVTGRVAYTGDIALPGLLPAVLGPSPVARGTIRAADTLAAEVLPGILRV